MELDHVFICAGPGAHEAEALKEFGLSEGSANIHPKQGTANRRFFFGNAFIELLYLRDAAEARSAATRPTALYERLSSKDGTASPFGICFRPAAGDDEGQAPFPGRGYRPVYLPAEREILIGCAPVSEPMWLFLSFASRPDGAPAERRQPLEHPRGFGEITSLRIEIPNFDDHSEPALRAGRVDGVEIAAGTGHLLQIGFDDASNGRAHDFRPLLPVVFRW